MFHILPMISTTFIAISAIFVAIGWYLIKQRRIEAHKKMMITGAVFALLFFTIYMYRTIFIGNMNFGGPEEYRIYYQVFLIFHITLATIAAVFGLVTLYFGFSNKISKHKKIGPITSVIWFGSAITGVMVYFLLFVLYQGGETDSLFKTILNF
ncbi:DUF420 domain-containing protein [Brevibacillus daliensis]|uniref:DUF420 domain-containing protein n=1 Tax=Brevibacillus daliensis TaxID=2892995 RepID=UPI001E45FE34|nr:DUF420 domain-containing protein [Brevibacillus daliensis]